MNCLQFLVHTAQKLSYCVCKMLYVHTSFVYHPQIYQDAWHVSMLASGNFSPIQIYWLLPTAMYFFSIYNDNLFSWNQLHKDCNSLLAVSCNSCFDVWWVICSWIIRSGYYLYFFSMNLSSDLYIPRTATDQGQRVVVHHTELVLHQT